MMSSPKISIIVPIHNAGSYLGKCLSSLVSQTLNEIEIILVLDNPTDGSDKVATEFADKDNRIKVLRNDTNLHTGLSRNRGLNVAQGEYIGFMDHDDYCEPSMFQKLYDKAKEKDADIVRCNFFCAYIQDSIEKIESYNYPPESFSITDKKWLYKKVSNNSISCVIWNHIYKRTFIESHKISFLDSRAICSEDSIFFLEAYHGCETMETISDYLYFHIFHNTNTGKAYDYRSIEHRIAFFEKLHSMLIQYNIKEEDINMYMAQNALRSLYSGSRQAFDCLNIKDAIREIKTIGHSRVMQSCIVYIYRIKNRKKLLELKPTIIALFAIFYLKFKTNKIFKR